MKKPVLVINPNTSAGVTAAIRHGTRGMNDVEVVNVAWGPQSVESELDSLIASTAVVETIWDNRRAYSGFVIACFDDPGLLQAREIVSAPVVGIGEAAITAARDEHHEIGVIVVADRVADRVRAHFGRYGVEPGRLHLVSMDGSVADLNSPGQAEIDRFVDAAEQVRKAGATCVVLACAGFSHCVDPIRERVGLPVMDGNRLGPELVAQRAATTTRTPALLEPPQPFEGRRPPMPSWAVGATTDMRGDAR